MGKLSTPDKTLVSLVLKHRGFDERLIGYRVRQRMGAMETPMYSFEEVVGFLDDKFPLLRFEELEKWLRTIVKDEELSAKIAEAVTEENNDYDRTQRVKKLMKERLSQCKNASLNQKHKSIQHEMERT